MRSKRNTLFVLSILAVSAVLLSACGPAVTPIPTEAPAVDAGPVTLTVDGMVDNELLLSDAALHGMTVVTLNLTHPKNGAQDFTGVRLSDLLTLAGVQAGATAVTFTASDGFSSEIDLAAVQACTDCLVAFDPETAGVYNLAMASSTSGKDWIKTLVTISVK